MLDRDLAEIYGVKPFRLREQVKRNIKRFPEDFCFQITEEEYFIMVSQNATPSKKQLGGHLPYVFTESGVAILSGILNSDKAIEINIKIIREFIKMRKFLSENNSFLQKFQQINQKCIEYDENFNKIFKAIEKPIEPKYGIFFENQIFDAYIFITDLIKASKESIILIDNYIDESVLTILSNKNKNIKIKIYTKEITEKLILAKNKFNEQYKDLEIKTFYLSHDRFLIIDNNTYHLGASLKDLGKRWFAFSKMNITEDILSKLPK